MQIIYYTLIIYLIFFALTYSYTIETKNKISKRNTGAYVILAAALVLRLLISANAPGYQTDMQCFKGWAQKLADYGTLNFYNGGTFADYPPGYMLVLYVLGVIGKLLHIDFSSQAFSVIVRLPSLTADLAIGYIAYKFCLEKQKSKPTAFVLMMLILFSPALIINSAVWGQIDSFFTLFLILSLISIYNEKYYMGAFLYTVCALIKPQAFMLAPVYLCVYISLKDWKLILKSVLVSAATVFAVALPFSADLNFIWLFDKYKSTLISYPYATINAYNIYYLFGYNWKEISDTIFMLPISVWSYLIIVAVTIGSIWFYMKSENKSKVFYAPYLIIAAMFTLGAKMHERYLFPALIFLAFTYIYNKEKRILFLFILQSAAHYLNVADVLRNSQNNANAIGGIAVLVALFHMALLVYSFYLAYDIYIPHSGKKKISITTDKLYISKPVRNDYIIMAVITLVYCVIAFIGLGDAKAPQTFYKNESAFVVDLGETKEIGSILMYFGIGDGNYQIQTSNDGEHWADYANQKHDSVFIWRRAKGTGSGRYISFLASKKGSMLGEISVRDTSGNIIKIEAGSAPEVIDEQNVVPFKPSYMNGTYFDEIYHPRTAYEILHRLAPYEVTHPPLGKVIMSFGIMIFGMTPFGWRFMGTVAGIIMVPLFYLTCRKLIDKTEFAVIGTIIFTFDFMHFAQTRMGTIDSFAVLFIMLMYYFIIDYAALDFNKEPLKKGFVPLALCGISFGIGASTKWICLYSSAGLALILIFVWARAFLERVKYPDFTARLTKTLLWCVLFFVVIPSIIYFTSYIPQMRYDLNGRTPVQYVLENQKYMLNYHKGVTDPHPYSSKWYEWIVDKRPLWGYIDNELKDYDIISSISTFGNPLVWWGGAVALFGCIYISVLRKNSISAIIVTGYLSQLIPWMFVSRVLFIYHYFACAPFIALATAYFMKYLCDNRGFKIREMYGYCAVAVLLFIMFYPVISGINAEKWYVVNVLQWFNSWTFTN